MDGGFLDCKICFSMICSNGYSMNDDDDDDDDDDGILQVMKIQL